MRAEIKIAAQVLLVALCQIATTAWAAPGDPQYRLIDLGTFCDIGGCGASSRGISINANGQVTGWANTLDGWQHAFLYSGGPLIDLNTIPGPAFGGNTSFGFAVNDSGEVTGGANTLSDVAQHAFLYSAGVMTDLGTLDGTNSLGNAINASGQIAGYANLFGDASQQAFLYAGGPPLQNLNSIGPHVTGSSASAINSMGQIAGVLTQDFNNTHAFLYSLGSMTDLSTLGGPNSAAYAINGNGQVAGTSGLANGTRHAFLYPDPKGGAGLGDLGTLGGPNSDLINVTALNSRGQAIGQSDLPIDPLLGYSPIHAFIYPDPKGGVGLGDLGTLGGDYSSANAINDNDKAQIVGSSYFPDNVFVHQRAFLYPDSTGSMVDLNLLIVGTDPLASRVTLSTATAINDRGWIVASGRDASCDPADPMVTCPAPHAYLVVPVNAHDGTLLASGGTVYDNNAPSGTTPAQVTAPPNVLPQPTRVTISIDSAPPAVNPTNLGTDVSYFVTIDFSPLPGYPLKAPGLTIVLPLINPLAPNKSLLLYSFDKVSGNFSQMLDAHLQPISGTVDASGLTATFMGITHFSEVVALIPGSAPPVVTPAVTGTSGMNGWYTGDVTVAWAVTDAGSTVTSQSGCDTAVVSTDIVSWIFTCSATNAGGTTTKSVTIKRDTTRPTVSGTLNPLPNANGWNNTNVVAHFTGSDVTSGIGSCTADQILSEGAGQSGSGTCTDLAGNTSAATTLTGINIDKTPPTVTALRNPGANGNGWNNTPVIVSVSGVDSLSMVPGDGCTAPVTLLTSGAGQSAGGSCADLAGNTASASILGINIDLMVPTATVSTAPAPNGAGWNNTNVTVSFSGTDNFSGSGVASCTGPTVLTLEVAGQSASGTCLDMAGNTSAVTTKTGINIDKTAPTIAVTTPSKGAVYTPGQVVYASYTCTDAGSGVSACSGTVANGALIDTSGSTGVKTFVANATDTAGNASSSPITYSVFGTSTCHYVTLSITPTQIAKGGTITVSAALTSCASAPIKISESFTLTGPLNGGSCTQSSAVMFKTPSFTLNPGVSQSISFPVKVPKAACAGSFTATANTLSNGAVIDTSFATLTVK